MAGSGDILVLQQPALSLDEEKDSSKKKRFAGFKLKNFKQLFTRKKRIKSKDEEEENVKAKSTTNVHAAADEDGRQEPTHLSVSNTGALSVSHDSVFSPDKPREVPKLGELKSAAISMDRLPGGNPFASELTSAVRRRRGNSLEEDEALPESPYPYPNTTQAVIENGLKSSKKSQSYDSCQSDRSLMSMDSSENELEEDFFHEKWTSSTSLSKRTASPDPGSGGSDIDLDVIAVTEVSLNTAAARHKISVKPKSKRPVSHIGKSRRRPNSPRPVTTHISVMPEVQEENVAKSKTSGSFKTENDKQSGAAVESLGTSPETKVQKSPRAKVKFQEPAPDYDEETNKQNVDIIVADTSNVTAPKPMKSIISASKPPPTEKPVLKSEKPQSEKSVLKSEELAKSLKPVQQSPIPAQKESPVSPLKSVSLRKTAVQDSAAPAGGSFKDKKYNYDNVIPVAEVKKDEKSSVTSAEVKPSESKPAESKSEEKPPEMAPVIMRPKSTALQDSSKRKTIGSGSGSDGEVSVFGELKLKRASLHEARDWDNLDKAKNKDTSSSDTSPDNEFSQMFSKFQRRASQKRDNHPEMKSVDIKVESDKSSESTKKSETKGATSSEKSKTDAVKDSDSREKSASEKPTPVSVKPSSVSSQAAIKSGSTKPNEVPSVTSSKTVSETVSKTVKDEERPSSFILKPAGGSRPSSGIAKSVFIGAKSNASQESTQERPKSVLVEKSKDTNEKVNVSDNKTQLSNSENVENSEKKSVTESFPKKALIIEEKNKSAVATSQSQTNTAKQSNTNNERNVTLVLNKQQTPSYVKNTNNKQDENTKPTSDAQKSTSSTNPYKRASPLMKDRFRSQTLPEQTSAQKDVLQQKTDNKSDTKNAPSPNMPQRSKSVAVKPVTKPAPVKKIEITEKSSVDKNVDNKASTVTQGSGQPTWISLAKKKTGTYTKDESPPSETKPKVVEPPPKQESKEDEDKAPSIQDLMKRFQKH